MPAAELDPTDRGIVYLLQEDARHNTTAAIGEEVGVAASTVATRIRKLEERNVITGYHPTVDYGKAGFDHHFLVVGTAPFEERAAAAETAIGVRGVVNVRERLTDRRNVSVEVVASTRDDVERSLAELNDAGIDIERTELLKRELDRPFDGFGRQFTDDG